MEAYNLLTFTIEDYNFYMSLSNDDKIWYIHDICLKLEES